MPEHTFTDETATVVVLHGLVNDMKHVLDWLAIALFAGAVVNVIHAVESYLREDWLFLAFDVLMTAAFAAWCYDTAKRAGKYGVRR